jgi:hypothetical protein
MLVKLEIFLKRLLLFKQNVQLKISKTVRLLLKMLSYLLKKITLILIKKKILTLLFQW